jgi:CheY-like chemotaxis protein
MAIAGRRARIAIIEDDSIFGEVLGELLSDEGYEPIGLATATRAHEFVIEQRPDLVLLDLVFDREALGWDMLDAHIVDPRTRETPVVLMTVDSPAARARNDRLQDLGVPLLVKPFEFAELLTVLARALHQERGRPRLVG